MNVADIGYLVYMGMENKLECISCSRNETPISQFQFHISPSSKTMHIFQLPGAFAEFEDWQGF